MKYITRIVIIASFILSCFSGVCRASSTKPPEPLPGEKDNSAKKESRYAAFYAHPKDLNEDGVIDSRDRYLWKKQQDDEMVVE